MAFNNIKGRIPKQALLTHRIKIKTNNEREAFKTFQNFH